jgi:hypothetical protein
LQKTKGRNYVIKNKTKKNASSFYLEILRDFTADQNDDRIDVGVHKRSIGWCGGGVGQNGRIFLFSNIQKPPFVSRFLSNSFRRFLNLSLSLVSFFLFGSMFFCCFCVCVFLF